MNNLTDDVLRIQASDWDEEGNKLEPEEKPAEKISPMEVNVNGSLTGANLGQMASTVAVQGTAGRFAEEVRKLCANCKHCDFARWQQLKKTPRGQALLPELYAAMVQTGNAQVNPKVALERDPEGQAALNYLGICNVMTDIASLEMKQTEEIIVHPMGTCPQGLGAFSPRGTEAERASEGAYDEVMRHAQGRG